MTTDNAFCFQAKTPNIDTKDVFSITAEDEDLRVENINVNLLYNKLTLELFDTYYNYFNKFINFDFNAVIIDGVKYQLSTEEQEYLRQFTITNSIYAYTINQAKITLKPNKISLKVPFDELLVLLDNKYGIDTKVGVIIGARVLRRTPEEFQNSVKQRRQYYNK
jgi:hypothetical protein